MNLFETALFWVQQGYSVIPIRYYGKKPLTMKLQDGKWETYQTRLPTELELKTWFPSYLANIALITGWNNLAVIDFDVQEVFDYWYSLYPIKTYMVKTRRGVHVYVKTHEIAKNHHNDLLDIRAEREYILIPPSIHPSGYQYQVFQNTPIITVEKLTDILPELFTPEPEKVTIEPRTQYQASDPWSLADQAIDIDEDLIQKIRANHSILDLLPGAEQSSRDGRWYVTLCPFHNDHSPSFWIDTKRGICGCRRCNIKEMDVINLYARLHNISNQEAIYELSHS